jgi:hypothetical protein
MIFPRTRRQSARYGRHKALAALATFVVVWTLAQLLGWDDRLRERFQPTPPRISAAAAFRDRLSDVTIEGEGVVEAFHDVAADGDSVPEEVLVRLASGHPIWVRSDSARIGEGTAIGDTLQFLGSYEWDNRGGIVHVGPEDVAVRSRQQVE